MAASDLECWADDGGLGAGGPQPAAAGQHPTLTNAVLARLVRTIEGEIVPRLLMAQRAGVHVLAAAVADRSSATPNVDVFVAALLRNRQDELDGYVESLRAHGVPGEVLLLELFAPAARSLGRMWEDDTVGFAQVTLALAHLHRLVHELRREHRLDVPNGDAPRVLLTVTADEQHLFGMLVVADFFRNAGWNVDEDPLGVPREVAEAVRQTRYDVVGVSVSTEDRVAPAAALVRTIRRASANPHVTVMAGGPVFLRVPEVAAQLAVDAIACDGRQAVVRARELVDQLRSPKTRRV
jgi:methylmalonyl-CoA mutase cobalamin-binding domain/chain